MNYGILAHWKNNFCPPSIKRKGIVAVGRKKISPAESRIFVVELKNLWEFTSINAEGKKIKVKRENMKW